MSEPLLHRYIFCYSHKLQSGDRMNRDEFHRIYETMPDEFKAELLAGTVFVSMPLGRPHGKGSLRLGSLLDFYAGHTPGLEACDNTTVLLAEEDEVQPDLLLRVTPEHGGQSKNSYSKKEDYVVDPPELIAEVAHSSRAIDLHLKKERYAKAGVCEYIVFCLEPKRLYWFDLKESDPVQLNADQNSIIRSRVFPGLWIHTEALIRMELKKSMQVLQQGLASPEYAEFVRKLQSYRR